MSLGACVPYGGTAVLPVLASLKTDIFRQHTLQLPIKSEINNQN